MPDEAAIISAATTQVQELLTPSLSPVNIYGAADGKIILKRTCLFDLSNIVPTSSSLGSVVESPAIVFINIGQKLPSTITATFDVSPIPSDRIKSGISAIAGIGLNIPISATVDFLALLKRPIIVPKVIPNILPTKKPLMTLEKLDIT